VYRAHFLVRDISGKLTSTFIPFHTPSRTGAKIDARVANLAIPTRALPPLLRGGRNADTLAGAVYGAGVSAAVGQI
jgi:hypothetical protein